MGKVTFWGIQHGLGVTSLAAAVAAFMGTGYAIRTLVTQPQWSDFTLEKSFGRSISSHSGFFC
ncbi:hypothetical protein AWM70_12645 [Paenibacillus yonginensis]|uniref:Uncharacterized protein n=1 Tax=Paenibacillus yonginensis TaxID=1462996 RepID=A0A1B1N1P1_9BACL|nr:hypothetical protein AWM70_12645 [Paenibacillus yonginensis]